MRNLPYYEKPPIDLAAFCQKKKAPCCRMFDDLLCIHNEECACLVLKTDGGLVLIDAILKGAIHFENICESIAAQGWEPADIKMFIISHGHGDHTGCGKMVLDHFHPQVYMSGIDYEIWSKEVDPLLETPGDFVVPEENHLADGAVLRLGAARIVVYSTPGHTPGSISLIFPVHDLGRTYMAALWGGAGVPKTLPGIIQYMESLDHFEDACDREHVSVAVTTHPKHGNWPLWMELCSKRFRHEPNPFVLGEDGYRTYMRELYRRQAYEMLRKIGGETV